VSVIAADRIVTDRIPAGPVGSFVRPAKLQDAIRAHRAGSLDVIT
jgi:hypothetical protein